MDGLALISEVSDVFIELYEVKPIDICIWNHLVQSLEMLFYAHKANDVTST